MMDNILEARSLTKEFNGFVAVDDVSLQIRRGGVHALIGPNGAGKTTCFNLLTKFLNPTRGTIVFEGRDITALDPASVAELGIIRSFQISAVFPTFSALHNVRLALQQKYKRQLRPWKSLGSLDVLDEEAMKLLELVGLLGDASTLAIELPYGRKRALEFATTLALEPKLMLLDEPMAGIGTLETDHIVDLIRTAATRCTIVMVEHNLSVVSALSDNITVLARGRILAQGAYSEISTDPRVIEAYIGVSDD